MSALELHVTLTVTEGDDVGRTFELTKPRTTVGRRDCDIRLKDTKVSSSHAVIDISGLQVHITDLNSRNGLFVNNQKVNRSKLQNLDELQLGFTKLKIVIVEDLAAFKQRNLPAEKSTPARGTPSIGQMIEEELGQFSKWDLSQSNNSETVKGSDILATQQGYRIDVIGGPDSGKQFRIEKKSIQVGRNEGDLVLHDEDVSRLHCVIEVMSDGQVWVRDAGSTNGTKLNQRAITEAKLVVGDTLQIGNTLLRLSRDSE